jgi:NADPH-dependent ferric siderophore reductase
MKFAPASVVESLRLNERFHRVVLHVPDLSELALRTSADSAIGMYFPDLEAPSGRTYTVRDCDAVSRHITVDFLLHGDGIGTNWVQRTSPADKVTLAYPCSWYQPQPATVSQLLVADLAGFPAMARVIERLPPGADAVAVVEILDESDLDYLPQCRFEVVTAAGTGNGIGKSVLSELVRERHLPTENGYCWFAGEASEARAIRKYLRHELG